MPKATGLQLYEVNSATLTQWYQKYEKARETAVLKQTSLLLPSMTTSGTAPAPHPQATVPTAPSAPSFEFRLPADPTGCVGRRKVRLQKDEEQKKKRKLKKVKFARL